MGIEVSCVVMTNIEDIGDREAKKIKNKTTFGKKL